MNKLKVGDTVVIHKPLAVGGFPVWTAWMDMYDGSVQTIKELEEIDGVFLFTVDGFNFNTKWATLKPKQHNPVKTISRNKYYRCRGEHNTRSVQFNSDKGILFMTESLCGKYYYWSDYDCNNNVIYRRGEKSWVEDNYESVKDIKLASFKVPVENDKVSEEDNTQLWDNRELGCDENFLKVKTFDEDMEKTIEALTNGATDKNEWTDKHYDFNYTLTEKDIESGVIKIDPYFVAKQWKLGSKDDSGALWHTFKGIARYGEKNSVEREIRAFHAQIKRLAELNGVKL